MREIIFDNFRGRSLDIAINHDPAAIAMHRASHPEFNGGQLTGLVWMSPDCKHFCEDKGGRTVDVRDIDWAVAKAESDRIKKLLEGLDT